MKQVRFRFYEELNNYLPEEKRKVWFEYFFTGIIVVQDAIQFYWIRSSDSLEQVNDLINKMDLSNLIHPLTCCLNCNAILVPVEKQTILHRLQDRTAKYYNEYFNCTNYNQIYWKGSHFENMLNFISINIIANR